MTSESSPAMPHGNLDSFHDPPTFSSNWLFCAEFVTADRLLASHDYCCRNVTLREFARGLARVDTCQRPYRQDYDILLENGTITPGQYATGVTACRHHSADDEYEDMEYRNMVVGDYLLLPAVDLEMHIYACFTGRSIAAVFVTDGGYCSMQEIDLSPLGKLGECVCVAWAAPFHDSVQ